MQALYLIKFLENFHSQNYIERNTIEEMAQNLVTTLLHKTICVVMSAGVIVAYDTEKLSFKCYMITGGLKVAISHLKKMTFFHGLLREFMIECVGTRYPVRCARFMTVPA